MLSLVTDNQPEPLFIVDEELRLWLANAAATSMMNSNDKDLVGKPLASIAGNAIAMSVQPHCKRALESGVSHTALIERLHGTELHTISTRFVPLPHIPAEGSASSTRGVLICEQDITETLNEREKRLHTLNQLIAMLVSLIDRRDPHAAQYSAYVALVAAATARDMGLSAEMIETTETAARLMNLGKVDIPAEMLVRKGALNNTERDAMRHSLSSSANLLQGIEFNGPVSETLRQAQEHVDGSGPMALASDSILISSRIIAVANALVSMISPRAYRDPLTIEEATKNLLASSDKQFDRKVVIAVINYIDNHGGRLKLETLQKKSLVA